MSLAPNRPGAIVRRATLWSLVVDVVAAILLTWLVGATVGFIVLVIGLVITGFLYWNYWKAQRTRGSRY
jgi:Zn-dependent protease